MTTGTVVGGGPNGLAAAITLARAGIETTLLEAGATVGGGVRSFETLAPGLVHDHCAAIHPMAVGSPFLATIDIAKRGLRWRSAELDCVHPLDDGSAGVLHRGVDETAAGMGPDSRVWRSLFGRSVRNFDAIAPTMMGPMLRVPRHPVALAEFGMPTPLPAAAVARAFRTPTARGLWAGIAAHTFQPLHRPMTSAIGLGLITAGHRHGWQVAEGGSGRIAAALAAEFEDLGGRIETGARVTAGNLPETDVTLFDLDPRQVAGILGDRLPRRIGRALNRFRHGPGAFKVDFAVQGGVPWTNPDARRSGTVHLGGEFAEVAATEREIAAGRMPERPFVLVGQQYLADPSRSSGDVHPVWSYAHVPAGFTGDATGAIIAQIERFAPGFRERIVGTAVCSTTEMSRYNANFVGGDINTGAKDPMQLVFGPRITLQPYDLGVPGMYICSAATPPGPAAHGMCGFHAASRALAKL
ncbi:FAD dependent oxidoreductase OS=Tsukamurella paurometabola (strain ATCC 8368 / DSM / CCUG 35730/ CIP 100753 / JCM 10117 / KCTC 9821 / NBRC 16120 / NCIMB 702349 / NCTC 13040) OX=521096 GN=Tpau_2860 PE=4 SV=1 [Tsukamurella paurometabola]|uniref:FAD dependent oxidoreductase n=1 Tax=Tsukamurella paurometabola (strain ATCC 8368 / DSM 20162 / CCUG 35730 / CIP 100753 / JCM 10117 / KCTC 9821 / NBRC 16120 / NCIMB 702349 / NCTC 13040) TaxID=521096 RepID=D5UTH3_TSUPD|nr:NAD(P)/FAD-dependent oxidoreductase [Tsukamurella paurometabola]ADG79458.1 FAD dependent oxidoreductase [Tsukamurella paurometabola DSM 20162]SUP35839.1 Protoporphyrinogen oxidase [Tsukamurella paurometabola]